jgi:heterodisulfide reductase subunit A-like polyferredoxin
MEKQEKKTKVVIVGEQIIASEPSCNEPDLKMLYLSRLTGAGIGGVATAARLADAGFDVEVYEKVNLGHIWLLLRDHAISIDVVPSRCLIIERLFRRKM